MRKFLITFAVAFACVFGVTAARAQNNCTGATYYDAYSDTCIACPSGYEYNKDSGKTSVSQCQIHCNAGTWVGGYTRLEYIGTRGSTYIDTNLTVDDFDRVTSRVTKYGVSTYETLFGASTNPNSASGNAKVFRLADNGQMTMVYGTSWFHIGTTFPVNTPTDVDVKISPGEQYVKINGQTVASGTLSTTLSNPNHVFIFDLNAGGSAAGQIPNLDCEGMTFYMGNTVVADFVPVRRNADNVVGMYDLVGHVFYPGIGESFVAGPDLAEEISTAQCDNVGPGYWAAESVVNYGSTGTRNACPAGTYSDIENGASVAACKSCTGATYNSKTAAASCIACPRGYDYNNDSGKMDVSQCQIHCVGGTYVESASLHVVPNGYTQLEYLESTGTQWIDTEYVTRTTNIRGEIRVGVSKTFASSANVDILGNQGDSSKYKYSLGWANEFKLYIGSRLSGPTQAFEANSVHDLVYEFGDNRTRSLTIDGATPISGTYGASYTPISPASLALFTGRDAKTASFKNGRIYYFKLYADGELVRDMVPARRDSDGVVGMYDIVTGRLFTNAGTETFITGSDNIGKCVNVSAGYYAPASTVNYGDTGTRTACPVGSTTVGYGHGADTANDCARIMRIGDYVVYGRRDQVTMPSLNINIPNERTCYISLSPDNHSLSRLHLSFNGVKYTAYDDSSFYGELDFDTDAQIVQ